MAKVMWQFNTKEFSIIWLIEQDVLDTSYMDRELADECKKNVRSRKWKCFSSEMKVVHRATGITLGEDFLGNSIYAKPAEFRDHFGMNRKGHGSYFSDMVRSAISDARKNFPILREKLRAEILAKERALAVRLRTESRAVLTA